MKPQTPSFSIKKNGEISMYISPEMYTVAPSHVNYSKIVSALKAGNYSAIKRLVNLSRTIVARGKGKVAVKDGQVLLNGIAIHSVLTDRILKMLSEGFSVKHMVAFFENLMQNPSKRAIDELYPFLENAGLPITTDGHFLAYKAVTNDYLDIYTGKIKNAVGSTVSMPRNQVDDTYTRDCSTGLHCGALHYVIQYGHFPSSGILPPGGNRLLMVKVNPADVVSVPQYEKFPKIRVSKYVVVSEFKDVFAELRKAVYNPDASEYSGDDATDSDENSADYDRGVEIGNADFFLGKNYGTGFPKSPSDDFVDGYADAWDDAEGSKKESDDE